MKIKELLDKYAPARHLQVYLNQRKVVKDGTFFTYRGEGNAKTIHR